MKIAIVSDTHDNIKNFIKSIEYLNKNKVKTILHCGDISNQETIDVAKSKFKGQIKFVKGNADFNLVDLPEKMEIKIEGKNILFCHFPEIARKAAGSGKYDMVFYGHTHRPWEERVAGCRIANPGELAGQLYKPTFAIYDTETDLLQLKILDRLH